MKEEAPLLKKLIKKGPCWKKYKQVGMKMKGNRKVPNCVPKSKKFKHAKSNRQNTENLEQPTI